MYLVRICFSLALVSLCSLLLAYSFGLMPDEHQAELDSRATTAQALAVQLISEIAGNDHSGLASTMQTVVERNSDILSIGLRSEKDGLVASAGDHPSSWPHVLLEKSTPTHVQVPIVNEQKTWGALEILFIPTEGANNWIGIPTLIVLLFVFVLVTGFASNYLVLRRSLKVLDPSDIVSERVQRAYDTLAEGAVIIDKDGYVLLANKSFFESTLATEQAFVGSKISDLKWHQEGSALGIPPWEAILTCPTAILDCRLILEVDETTTRHFSVNATSILDQKSRINGAIITFDDLTEIQSKNDQLSSMVSELEQHKRTLTETNRELHRLATRDPMTDCYNRRAFFEIFETQLNKALAGGKRVFCLMSDLDHFKRVNDTYGHAVGDDVIIAKAKVLTEATADVGFVGRYGGEEFCTILVGADEATCRMIAERVRISVISECKGIGALKRDITTSIGFVEVTHRNASLDEWVSMADEALYAAKEGGRNRVIGFNEHKRASHQHTQSSVELSTATAVQRVA